MDVGKSSSVRSLYLRTLGFESRQGIEHDVTNRLANAIREKRGDSLPVRLSGTLEDFLIDSQPRWNDAIPHGRLEFDESTKRFVVYLGAQWRTGATTGLEEEGCGRLRFTYAHEVAHRFFFVERNGCWKRALDIVADSVSPSEAFRARRVLSDLEESLCNSIAARVLIPGDKLAELCATRAGFTSDTQGLFCTGVTTVARLFAVTRKCFLVRLRKAIDKEEIHLGGSFCALLCGISNEKGPSRSHRRMRVTVPIVPSRLGGYQLPRKFNGISVRTFGEPLHDLCAKALTGGPANGRVEVPLRLRRVVENKQESDFNAWMTGNWRRLKSGEVLVWGRLRL